MFLIFQDDTKIHYFSTPKLSILFNVTERTIERDIEKMIKWGIIVQKFDGTKPGKYTIKTKLPGFEKLRNIYFDEPSEGL